VSDAPLALVPPVRLGTLLHDAREGRGTKVDELASRSFFTVEDLRAIESGDRNLTDRELSEVLDVYAVDADHLVPERAQLVIDLDERVLAAGGAERSVAGRAPTADAVLASYLSLVYTLRHTEPGTPIVLRETDVDVLARVLDLAKPAVASRLHLLMSEPAGEVRRRSRLLRGRVLVPLAGVVVAATAVGALLLVQVDEGQSVVTEPGAAAPEPAFVMTNPDGSTTPVYIGDNLDPDDLPPGAVALAPATQQYPDGVTVVNGEGQQPPTSMPDNEVWVGDPQVAVQNDDGTVTQSTREP
jgi:transcriptional regulator with XRE-family HTH domain